MSRACATAHHNTGDCRSDSLLVAGVAFLASVLPADGVVDHGVPGIVNADEQQQQYGGANAKQRLARESEGCHCG